jgi:hypothetical protein
MLLAAEPWKTKEYTQWSDEEISKVLSDSPWAKEKTVAPQQAMQQRGMSRRGGGGFGYPGGGGGGGYPGGGGGGYPGGGQGGGQGGGVSSMNVTVRWESGMPIQHALLREGPGSADEAKAAADASAKDYVIAVLGFRLPNQQRSRSSDSDDDQDRGAQSKDRLRSQLLDAAELTPKGKNSIYAEDVQIDGSGEIRFLFPRSTAIVTGDKEVDFVLQVRGIKVEQKFHLNDMQYQGKLAI